MKWDADRTNRLVDLRKQFTDKYERRAEKLYLEAGIVRHNWHRLATVGDGYKDTIFDFLIEPEHGLSPKALDTYGVYDRESVAPMFGDYRLYRPDSEDPLLTEVFSARIAWSNNDWCATITVQNEKKKEEEDEEAENQKDQTTFQLYKPKNTGDMFYRTSIKGWNSLSIIDRLERFRGKEVMMGVSLAMDTLPDERILRPVLFPIVLERLRDLIVMKETRDLPELEAYRNIGQGEDEYDKVQLLLKAAASGKRSVLDVWERFRMHPGQSNGGPSNP